MLYVKRLWSQGDVVKGCSYMSLKESQVATLRCIWSNSYEGGFIDCIELCGVVWSCMELYGVVWSCMELFGVVWSCMELYGVVWSCMEFYGVV